MNSTPRTATEHIVIKRRDPVRGLISTTPLERGKNVTDAGIRLTVATFIAQGCADIQVLVDDQDHTKAFWPSPTEIQDAKIQPGKTGLSISRR